MKVDHLLTFKRVAEHRSYTRAAEIGYLTQPAVYRQVKQLEAEAGATLVHVVGKEVHLTRAGEYLYEFARDVEQAYQVWNERMERLRQDRKRVVRVGASTYAGMAGAIARRVEARRPDITVEYEFLRPLEAIEQLRAGTIDFGFFGPVYLQADLQAEPCAEYRIVVVAPKGHELCGAGPLAFQDIQEYRFVGFQAGSGRAAIDQWAAGRPDIAIRYAALVVNSREVLDTVRSMGVLGFVNRSSIEPEIDAGDVHVLDVVDFSASYVLYINFVQESDLGAAARVYLEEARSMWTSASLARATM